MSTMWMNRTTFTTFRWVEVPLSEWVPSRNWYPDHMKREPDARRLFTERDFTWDQDAVKQSMVERWVLLDDVN